MDNHVARGVTARKNCIAIYYKNNTIQMDLSELKNVLISWIKPKFKFVKFLEPVVFFFLSVTRRVDFGCNF